MVNGFISLLVCFVFANRLLEIIIGNKAVALDWIVLVGGLLVELLNMAGAASLMVTAFTDVVINITTEMAFVITFGPIIIDLVLSILFLALMYILGNKDPTGLTFNLFMLAAIVEFLEFTSLLVSI